MRCNNRLLCLLLALSAPALGQEERAIDNFAGLGVRAMGMGGAYVGVADDFTAVFWNPAGLAQIEQREVYVALLRNGKQNDAVTGAGTALASRASADVSNTRFGSLGFVFPYPVYRGSFVLAAGFNRVKDFDWALHSTGFVDSLTVHDTFRHEGEMSVASLAAAVDVSPSVSLGMTLSLISGEDVSTAAYESIDTEDYFEERRFLYREVFLDDYGTTWTATLGAMVRVPREEPRVRLGLTLTTGPTHKVSYTFRAPGADFTSVEYDDGRLDSSPSSNFDDSYRISLPLSFGLGASYRPVPQLLLAGSVHATEWSQTEYTDADEFQLRSTTSFESQYDDILRWHLGAEWEVPWVALDVRAGYYTDPLPFIGPRDPERALDPVTNPPIRVLQERHFWTLGTSLLLEQAVRADLTYTRGNYAQAEGQGAAELREDVTIDRLFLGFSYRF